MGGGRVRLGGGGGVRVGGGQGGCDRRIEAFGKIHTKNSGQGWEGGSSGGVGLVGGVRVDVNAMLGVEGDVGYVNQE